MRKSLPFLLFFLPSVVFADEVFIKGAGSVSGRIVEQTATQVVVDVGGGTIGIPLAKVDHIVKAPNDLDEYDARAGRLAPWDIEGWRALARWASSKGLERQARQIYEMIVTVVPEDAEAEAALGFVLLDGEWVPRDEAYRARGYVKFDGEWMTPAEAQLRLDQAAAARSEREAAEQARADELEKLKAEVQAQYDAEAAADTEWRAEGAAWFYAQAYGCLGGCCTSRWPVTSRDRGSSWHRGAWHGR